MAEMTKYEPGTPSWVDLGSPDLDASETFYTGLFGWSCERGGEEAGGYSMFTLRGKNVAGLGPLQGEGMPSTWTTYMTVTDANATAAKVRDNGGTVVMEPFDVFDAGRMAVFVDPAGAFFSVWQPNQHIGAQLANEPGAVVWTELNTRELAKAKEFYEAIFGYNTKENPDNSGGTVYVEVKVDDRLVAGMMPMPAEVPAEVPSHWLTYFAVADLDASAAKVKELGGSVLNGPIQIPEGSFYIVSDDHSAVFGIFK